MLLPCPGHGEGSEQTEKKNKQGGRGLDNASRVLGSATKVHVDLSTQTTAALFYTPFETYNRGPVELHNWNIDIAVGAPPPLSGNDVSRSASHHNQSLMNFPTSPLLLFFSLFLLLSPTISHPPCSSNSPCKTLQSTHYKILHTPSCKSLYLKGSCPQGCYKPLHNLLTGPSWRECAHLCQWDLEFVESASGWLGLCRKWLQVEKVFGVNDVSVKVNDGKERGRSRQSEDGDGEVGWYWVFIKGSEFWRGRLWQLIGIMFGVVLLGGIWKYLRVSTRLLAGLRKWRRKQRNGLDLDPGSLNLSASSRLDLLRRGARRHFKSMRRMAD